jgi:hypothetical protein
MEYYCLRIADSRAKKHHCPDTKFKNETEINAIPGNFTFRIRTRIGIGHDTIKMTDTNDSIISLIPK